MFNQKKSEKKSKEPKKKSKSWSYPPISSFSWSIFEFITFFKFIMFLVIPEASNALKWMFFDALVIQEPSQIDPGSIWEKSFFMKIFKILTHMSESTFQKTHMYIHNLDNLRVPRPQAT